MLTCPGCGGEGCFACNGVGQIMDSGPAPAPEIHTGLCAFTRCGCARGWSGDGAPPEARACVIELWREHGMTWKPMSFAEASPLLTEGAGCRHADTGPEGA